ncbi:MULTISPECIES: hypothetical protein [Streptomyces]|uniref:hypothetical protein n=1 Tax=Streptomyces TaxID=1883 RepID=UPI00186AE24D|nr:MULTISPECIES: hypothetical protein [Streptomyces]
MILPRGRAKRGVLADRAAALRAAWREARGALPRGVRGALPRGVRADGAAALRAA